MKTKILLLLLCLSFLCCKKAEKRNNEITKITLSTGSCCGFCPLQTIEIDSSLTLRYHLHSANPEGFYIGKITPELWDSINIRFEKLNYKALKDNYETKSIGSSLIYLKIDYNKKQKGISASSEMPEDLEIACTLLMSLKDSIKLKQTTDILSFDLENINHTNHPLPILIEKK